MYPDLAEDEEDVSDIDDEDSEDQPEIDENYLNSDDELIMKKEVEEEFIHIDF